MLSSILRFYQLGTIPGSLNQDEAALGYNAYSLLKTGADEHGKFLPLSLQSFGDWKLPVYSLVAIPFIAIFGLTEIGIRMPSALAGILGVFLIYKITEIFFKDKKIQLLSAFFFAVSPWSIYLSRAAYEVNLATTFFLEGIYFLFSYLTLKKKTIFLIPASIFFGLSLFTYHTFILFIPLFLIGMAVIFYRKFILDKWTILGLVLTAFFIILSFITLGESGSNKISNLSILNDPNTIYNRTSKLKDDNANENIFISRLVYNKYSAIAYQFGQNYIAAFSPEFLFDKGGEKLQHNLGYFGNFYLFDTFILITGLLALFWYHEKLIILLVPWLLAAPVSSALTTDTPNTTRLFLLMPLAVIVMAYGAGKIIDILRLKRFSYLTIGILVVLFIANAFYFLDGYFIHFNVQRMRFWRYGEKQSVELARKYPKYTVVVRKPEDFHYIYFLFYEKYDPQKFVKEVNYYPITSEGFLHVKSFGRFNFVNSIDYNNLLPNTIYFDSIDPQNSPNAIYLPSGEPFIGYTISGDEKK